VPWAGAFGGGRGVETKWGGQSHPKSIIQYKRTRDRRVREEDKSIRDTSVYLSSYKSIRVRVTSNTTLLL
jgi:hypothetical protein